MHGDAKQLSVLFCCMGNICRSPTAEGVFRRQVIAASLDNRIRIDSAGTHDYHVGHAPDPRSRAAAAARGYELGALRARKVTVQDFVKFDYILAMDNGNLAELRRMAPREYRSKPRLIMEFGVLQFFRQRCRHRLCPRDADHRAPMARGHPCGIARSGQQIDEGDDRAHRTASA